MGTSQKSFFFTQVLPNKIPLKVLRQSKHDQKLQNVLSWLKFVAKLKWLKPHAPSNSVLSKKFYISRQLLIDKRTELVSYKNQRHEPSTRQSRLDLVMIPNIASFSLNSDKPCCLPLNP